MRKTLVWILGGAMVVAGLVGGQFLLRSAEAQDGLPDISGDWAGNLKGKAHSFENGVKPLSLKKSFAFAVSACGATVFADITPAGDDLTPLQGVMGNGHFWALGGTADEPFLMTGHVTKAGTKWKGTALAGHGEGSSDLTLSAAEVIE